VYNDLVMKNYKPRLIESKIKEKLDLFGGVLIQGARGVGKTTTAQLFAKSSIRLDIDEETQQLARLSPKTIIAGEVPRLIDE
jgi:predicted AAA+ superfamily ATPase